MGIIDYLGSLFGGSETAPAAPPAAPLTNPTDLGSLLQSNDLGQLRGSYNELINNSLKTPSRAEPDSNALFIQAGLPALAAAIFGGGKGIEAAAAPMQSVYDRELARAKDTQDNEQTKNLRGAQVIGSRITQVEDSFEKAASLEQRKQEKKDTLEQQDRLAKMSDDTRRDIASMTAGAQAESRAMRSEAQQFRMDEAARDNARAASEEQDAIEEKLGKEATRMTEIFHKEVKPLEEGSYAVDKLATALTDKSVYRDGIVRGALAEMSQGKQKITDNDIKNFAPINTAAGDAKALRNYIFGDTATTLNASQEAALKEIIIKKQDQIRRDYTEAQNRFKTRLGNEATLNKKYGRLESLESQLGIVGRTPQIEVNQNTPTSSSENPLLSKYKQLSGNK